MNIVILGAGKIGKYLSHILSKEEHNVTIIDKDQMSLQRIEQDVDVATFYGYGATIKTLESLLDNNPSHFIAITGNDETNLVACTIAKNLGYPITIARVKELEFLTRSRLNFSKLFFIDHFIAAEVLTAYNILKTIVNPRDLALENFAHGAIQMRTITIPKEWDKSDVSISELNLPKEMIVSLIRRTVEEDNNKSDKIIFPHGNDVIKVNDEVTIIGENTCMNQLHFIFKTPEKFVKSVILVGGTSVALHLAHILEKMHVHVTIIEKDEKKADEIADLFKHTVVINRDALNLNFLLEEQIQNTGAFVSCTSNDSTNLLLSLLAKQAGCKQVHSVISDIELAPVLRNLNIHFSISERVTFTNRILSIINEESVLSIASLCDNKARVIEMKVSEDSGLIGIPISELSNQLPKKLLIAAIENRGHVMIGKGTRILSPGDTIILITSPEHLNELKDLF